MGTPPDGRLTTMPMGRGAVVAVGVTSRSCASREIISVSSICARAKPMQFRAPRPKGTHA